ncbi:MAG: 16S rRNA (uracil(1498)-N(3))-methyltransferase [Pseudomonadales bacterium]|nr:16S rRNA (uracil(1498)-N(3))-methyltransferase [Pseudomonadales bacterium]MBP9036054.1 16S rRNA (uracil(1498)-N(3))-methyltransferase [Pseudomonadales bacterium]
MNLLLLAGAEIVAPGMAEVALSRYPARAGWWPPEPGRPLLVGLRDGLLGEGVVEHVGERHARIRFALDRPPAPALPLTLLLALPRPKMLRRVLRTAAEIGIKRIWLINSSRVEKSYWQSPLLAAPMLDGYFAAGLEQACDTVLPRVALRPRFRPFVEDELPAIAAGSQCLVAHPAAGARLAPAGAGHVTLAIGPEGGFTDFEIALLGTAGFAACTLGPRVLRVETALPVLAANLFPAGLSNAAADDAACCPPAAARR